MSESLITAEPILVRAGGGHRWLARSPQESGIAIAVVGNSEADARERYLRSAAGWAVLREAHRALAPGEWLVGESSSVHAREQVPHPLTVGPAAPRVHEVELRQVAAQVNAADVVVRSVE